MENNVIGIARLGVSLRMSATIENDCFSLEISVTFRLDVIIFAGLPEKKARKTANPPSLSSNADAYLKSKALKLKSIYDAWENYLETHKNDISKRVFNSMEELTEDLKSVCVEQTKVRAKIENLIEEVYAELQRSSLSDVEIDKTLKFISNCYQVIRDFSLSVNLGNQILEMSIDATEDADKIRKALMKKYKKRPIMATILQRKKIADDIQKNRDKISEITATYNELKNRSEDLAERLDVEQKRALCIQNSVLPIETAVDEWKKLERESIEKRLEIIERELEKYEKRISILSEDKGLFSKKKSQNAILEIQKLMDTQKGYRDCLRAIIENGNYGMAKADIGIIRKLTNESTETDNLSQSIRKAEKALQESRELETELLNEYEIIVKEFA